MSITQRYLGWDRPFCQVFSDHLKRFASGGTALDTCLVWVPSARAGRHILNELFISDSDKPEGIHPPVMTTPARFVQSQIVDQPGLASRMQSLQAWKTVLCATSPDKLKALFPFVPVENRDQWAYSIARQLMDLKAQLAEENWSISGLLERVQLDRERWQVLAKLESAYGIQLRKRSIQDPDDFIPGNEALLLRNALFERVLVAGVLNLSPRQVRFLETLDQMGLPVELCLPVPPERKDSIDQWGRPLPETWNTEPIPATLLEGRIQRAFEPRELVDSVLEVADQYGREIDSLVVSSPGEDLGNYLIERSRLRRTPFYAPMGKPLVKTGFGRLLMLMERILNEGRLSDMSDLLQNGLFRNWVKAEGLDVSALDRDLVSIQQEHFLFFSRNLSDPALAQLSEAGRIRHLFNLLDKLHPIGMIASELPDRIWNSLQSIGICQTLNEEDTAVLGQIEEILQDLKEQVDPENCKDSDYWELLKYTFEKTAYYPEREADQRPVSGWLELPWETAPHLVVLGLPDSEVPGNAGMNTFLTPGLCQETGLRSPEMESAFHAFRLRLILESRQTHGRVDILLPDRGLDDYPSQSSRFLYLASRDELLKRVHLLLDSRSPSENSLPATFGCLLDPEKMEALEKISVTDFKSYLQNPFHFYLERRLRWRVPEALPRELDALSFGTLAHFVLESFNSSESGRKLQAEKDIADYLEAILEDSVSKRFGSQPSLPVRIQVNSLRERFRAAVPDLSLSRRDGWLPYKVEWSWKDEFPFLIEGVSLDGKIDLVEWNEEKDLYRVIDYKTSDKGDGPRACHVSRVDARTGPVQVEESVFSEGKGTFRWIDLQLPLYQLALERTFGGKASCAYFNLARTVSQVGLKEDRFTEDQLNAALSCAEAVVRRIKAGEFPPAGRNQYWDRWLPWFGNNYQEVLAPSWTHGMEGPGT